MIGFLLTIPVCSYSSLSMFYCSGSGGGGGGEGGVRDVNIKSSRLFIALQSSVEFKFTVLIYCIFISHF